jgi:hypothetical protein
MDFAKAFSFPFEDPNWLTKLGLMALVSLIPVFGWLVLAGWIVEIVRRVIQRNPTPLPELEMGYLFGLGWKSFVAGLVYSLPIIILQIPIMVATNMVSASSSNGSASSPADFIPVFFSLCCGGLMLLYAIALAFMLPAALGNLAAKGNLGAAFEFKTIFGLLRAAPIAYLIAIVGAILVNMAAGMVGSIVCVIGVIFTTVYAGAVAAHFYGQAYNEATNHQLIA